MKIHNSRRNGVALLLFCQILCHWPNSLVSNAYVLQNTRTHKMNRTGKSTVWKNDITRRKSSKLLMSSKSTSPPSRAKLVASVGVRRQSPPLSSNLRRISNMASILCILDCTLLPIITVALSLAGFANAEISSELESISHSVALYFVLPVGGSTAVFNFLSHRQKWILSLAMLGLIVIALANLPDSFMSADNNLLQTIVHQHPSPAHLHRMTNTFGCVCLLASNYFSQQQQEECGCASPDCGIDSFLLENENRKSSNAAISNNSMARSIQYRQYLSQRNEESD